LRLRAGRIVRSCTTVHLFKVRPPRS
jgi:hypothetical protein